MACGPFFKRANAIRMHLDTCGIQRHSLDLDAHDLSLLQFLEHAIEHAGLGSAAHAGVDGVPVAEACG